MQSDAEIARSLIGTTSLPFGLADVRSKAGEAAAYHVLKPYPLYRFREWKIEDRGPLPECMPLCKSIVERGARWLFGKPIQINAPANPLLEEMLREAWTENRMGSRMVAAAEKAAQQGGMVLKFSYDETSDMPLSFQTLSIIEQVRLYYHPHNANKLLMARIQYPYFDAAKGKTFWYREEWTQELEVHYQPVPEDALVSNTIRMDPDTFDGWEQDPESTGPNPFGVIPLMPIKNIETDDIWGCGDLWDLFRVVDRINLTYFFMDQSNQYDGQLNPFFLDLELDDQDIDKPVQPGQPVELHSKEGEAQGKVIFPTGNNSLRPAMMDYAKDLRQQLLSAASSVEIDQSEVTNKGNLTVAVLEQLYAPQIAMTNEKRKTYGDDGLQRFFALVAKGLAALGVQCNVNPLVKESYAVEIAWPNYFDLSEDETGDVVDRQKTEIDAGFTTQERATKKIAAINGVQDTATLMEDLKPIHARLEAVRQAKADAVLQPVPPPPTFPQQ